MLADGADGSPNRLYFSELGTIDPDGKGGGPVLDNRAQGGKIGYDWETYPERLQRAGVSWQVYYDVVDDYLENVLRFYPPFRDDRAATAMYRQARTGRPIAQFHNDLRTGNLPQVTWILAHPWESEHPRFLPASGQDMVHQLLAALWRNPAVWSRTAFILMWDENDGQFDHEIAPPVPDPGTPGEFVNGLPIGLGFRVPCLVISPFSRGGYRLQRDTFDHTSVLAAARNAVRRRGSQPHPRGGRGVTGDLDERVRLRRAAAPRRCPRLLPDTRSAALGRVVEPQHPAGTGRAARATHAHARARDAPTARHDRLAV